MLVFAPKFTARLLVWGQHFMLMFPISKYQKSLLKEIEVKRA
jgi:hypothetical protein